MRYTLDTNIIKIRDVFAMNSKTGDFVEYASFPVIGNEAQLVWKSPLEFLGGISCMSTTVLGLLESVKPGMSTLSTNFTKGLNTMLISTVNKLGETYVSSTRLVTKMKGLTQEHGYISTTSFYECVRDLGKLDNITKRVAPMILFLQSVDSNLSPSGYVSTINPGKFHNYYSTLGFTGSLNNVAMTAGVEIQSLSLNLSGFEVLASSKLRLDINANVSVTQTQNVVTAFSTFLYNGSMPIGTPVVVNYSNLNFTMSKFTYFLTAADLSFNPLTVGLRHLNNTNATITVVPINICARMINMD